MKRDWRRDDGRLVGPYGIPAEYLTDAEKEQIDAGFRRAAARSGVRDEDDQVVEGPIGPDLSSE